MTSGISGHRTNVTQQQSLLGKDLRLASLVIILVAGAIGAASQLSARALLDVVAVPPLWLLIVGFAIAERWIIHVPVRRSSHTLTLSEVVFVVGLVFAAPQTVVIAHVIGGSIGLILDALVPWNRKIFNVANYAFSASISAFAFQTVAGKGSDLGTRHWLSALGAALLMSVVSLVGIICAMTVTGDRPRSGQLSQMVRTGLAASALDASIGVLVAVSLWQSPLAALMFIPLLRAVFLSTRAFVNQQRHQLRLEVLHDLTEMLMTSPSISTGLPLVRERLVNLFACETAEFVVSRVDAFARPTDMPAVLEWTDTHGQQALSLTIGQPTRGQVSQLLLRGRLTAAGGFTKEEKVFAQTISDHLAMMLRHEHLSENLAAAKVEVSVDPLTGIGNRRMLVDVFDALRTEGVAVTLLTLDLDGFKTLNDMHGHDTGDTALIQVARSMQSLVDDPDIPVRLGGDEFAVLVVGDQHDTRAADLAERLRIDLAHVLAERLPLALSASFGVASTEPGDTLRDLLGRSDKAMYEAKRQGKGRVIISA